MSSSTLLSLVLRSYKAVISNDFDRYLAVRKEIEKEAKQRQDAFDAVYPQAEAIFFNNLGRGRLH